MVVFHKTVTAWSVPRETAGRVLDRSFSAGHGADWAVTELLNKKVGDKNRNFKSRYDFRKF